jgi:HAD superfamily hydrolase (TIGR01509 family)
MHRLCLHPQSAMEVFVLFLWTQMEFVWVFLSPACRTDLLYRRLQKRFFALQEWLCQHPEYDALALADKVKRCHAVPRLVKKRQDANVGLITAREYYITVLHFLGVLPKHHDKALEVIYASEANIELYPTVRETVPALHKRGFKLGVLTDSMLPSSEKLKWLRAQGLDCAWDCFVNSCEVGYRKPSSHMYRTALDALSVNPSETLFVGHRQVELWGAKRQGIFTALINPDSEACTADFSLTLFADLLTIPCLLNAKSKAKTL